MEMRRCGNSALALPALGMGCWSFGGGEYWGEQPQGGVNDLVRRALQLGVNYFDTAEAYNEGRSEMSLGIALKGVPRDKVIVGTKVSPNHVQPQALPRHCEDSLKRLGTDYLDLYMVHWPITLHSIRHFTDETIACPSVEDAFGALRRLQDQGKVRFIGVSNFAAPKLKEALATGATFAVNELPYSLLARAIEWETLPFCRAQGIGAIGYFSLQQGLLADVYGTLDEVPKWQRRSRHFDSRKNPEARHGEVGAEEETNTALSGIRGLAEELGLTMPQVALKWAAANESISCVLAGSRSMLELEDNVQAVNAPLPPEALEKLDEITRPLNEKLGPSFDYYERSGNDRTL